MVYRRFREYDHRRHLCIDTTVNSSFLYNLHDEKGRNQDFECTHETRSMVHLAVLR